MIIREQYINQIKDFYDSDLIKIITGIRRSGKSVILEQIKNEIELRTDNILFSDNHKIVSYFVFLNSTENFY